MSAELTSKHTLNRARLRRAFGTQTIASQASAVNRTLGAALLQNPAPSSSLGARLTPSSR